MSEYFQALTFGLEFEFALAYIPEGHANPNPSDTRVVDFVPITADVEDATEVLKSFYGANSNEIPTSTQVNKFAIYRHIKNTLRNARYAVNSKLDQSSTYEWSVMDDSSIQPPETSLGYEYVGVELVSPAYYFCPGSLMAIEDVLALMTSTYLMNVNITTGLHVHIGNGTQGFKFNTLRKLVSFLFAFTPQLNTLHPPDRQADNEYINSLRENSRFEVKRRPTHKMRPTALDGVVKLLNSKDESQLFRYMESRLSSSKWMAYNLASLQRLAAGRSDRPTIEFRQHEGCVEATGVLHWLKTVQSIVDFCTYASASSFHQLLSVTTLETWEKRGDGLDQERKNEHGPAVADRDFTAIHLLQALQRWGPAAYYRRRGIYDLEMWDALYKDRDQTKMWDYEANPPQCAAQLPLQKSLRETWDALQAASKARDMLEHPGPEYYTFNRADSLWPAHNSILDDNYDTDATTPPDTPVSVSTSNEPFDTDDEDDGDDNNDGNAGNAAGKDREGGEAAPMTSDRRSLSPIKPESPLHPRSHPDSESSQTATEVNPEQAAAAQAELEAAMADAMDLFKPESEGQQSIEDQLAAAMEDLEDDMPDFGFEPTINADVAAAMVEGLNIPKPETTTQTTADLLAAAMADNLSLGSAKEEEALRAAFASDSGSDIEQVRFQSEEMESWPDPTTLTADQAELARMRWREMDYLGNINRR